MSLPPSTAPSASERQPSELARRDLVGALTGAALVGAAGAAGASTPSRGSAPAPLRLREGGTILFQGDSITDSGRDRKREGQANDHGALGNGYAMLAGTGMLCRAPEAKLQVHNRGISGHKVFQLAERWEKDCLDLKPDLVSILIGVNDIWHTRNGHYDGTVAIYERDYDALLARTREALPETTLLVCEPFVLRCGAVDESWFPEFDEYRAASRRVAEKHGATFVAFHSMFEEAVKVAPAKHWAGDGVHPTAAGAGLMAAHWLRSAGA